MHVIAAKAVAFKEALEPEFKTYQQQVVKNAQAMAKAIMARGYKIVSGGTENHLMLIDLIGRDVTGKDAEAALGKAHITVNKNAVPNDPRSPFVTSGLRIGTPAVTTRGYVEADCVALANWICDVLDAPADESVHRRRARERDRAVQAVPGLWLSADSPDALPLLPARRHPRDRFARVRRRRDDPPPSRMRGAASERFNTFETAELKLPAMVKSDGRREAFDERKLRTGFERALQKRPVSGEQIDAAVRAA